MTAVNPIPPNVTSDRDQRPYEPSMEEILASIRRIIADDQSLPRRQDGSPTSDQSVTEARQPEPDTTVHVLRPVSVPETALPVLEAGPSSLGILHASDANQTRDRLSPRPFSAHGTIAPHYATPEGPVSTSLGSYETLPEQDMPFDSDRIHQVEPVQRTEVASPYDEPLGRHEPAPFEPIHVDPIHVEPTSLFSAATDQSITTAFNTLAATRLADNAEDLLSLSREMIRPLLKTWLDENLPSMVERLVRAEIERVARGGR